MSLCTLGYNSDNPICSKVVVERAVVERFGGPMAIGMKQMSMVIATLGVLSFIFGVTAENKKFLVSGTAISGKGIVICKYKSDPTVALGYLSFAFLAASSVAGFLSLFYPYQGKSIPQAALLRNTSFVVFLNIALGTTGLAAALLLWPTISEQLHITRTIHHNLQTDCPTAKTGLLADNAREDYFQEADVKGELKASYADDEIIKTSA
ncbi:hypothetical protein RND71_023489 [Anisodus tanguticus]|uniref:Uncharacterized protein n=1 Tax=Anisodus tanguticus TaxID=243964 RepID=A0AAE1VDT8_9SOLA|nr:hypothetical protein RND71_023489 [Anisodus tanguticus]